MRTALAVISLFFQAPLHEVILLTDTGMIEDEENICTTVRSSVNCQNVPQEEHQIVSIISAVKAAG